MADASKERKNRTNLKAFFDKKLKVVLNKDWNIAAGAVIVLFFLGITAVYHDAQVKQGVGLYFSIYFNSQNRILFDILADAVRFFTIFLANLIPCILIKRCKPVPYLHILETYVALMPVTHMDSLIYYFSGEEFEWITFLPTIKWCLTYPVVVFIFYWLEKLYENSKNGKIWSKAFDVLLISKAVYELRALWLVYH